MKNKVKIYRKGHGLTQEQLAKIIGVTRQTIHAIEKNRFNTGVEIVFKLAQFFHTSAEELFIIEENIDSLKIEKDDKK